MALKSTIFKATVNIADMDRPYYGEHTLSRSRAIPPKPTSA